MPDSGGFVISKETWARLTEEERSWVYYETMQSVNERLRILEKWNKALSFVGGLVGGTLATFGIKWL